MDDVVCVLTSGFHFIIRVNSNLTAKGLNLPCQLPPGISSPHKLLLLLLPTTYYLLPTSTSTTTATTATATATATTTIIIIIIIIIIIAAAAAAAAELMNYKMMPLTNYK